MYFFFFNLLYWLLWEIKVFLEWFEIQHPPPLLPPQPPPPPPPFSFLLNTTLWKLGRTSGSAHLLMFDILCWPSFICPHLPGLLPPLPLHSLPVWIFHIAAAAGAWWGGLRSHCVHVAWVLRYAAPWRAVCRDRRVAADASRPPACLSAVLHLTDGDIAVSSHAISYTCTYTGLTYALQQQQICGPDRTGRERPGRCRRFRLDFGDISDACVGKMSPECNKDVIFFYWTDLFTMCLMRKTFFFFLSWGALYSKRSRLRCGFKWCVWGSALLRCRLL